MFQEGFVDNFSGFPENWLSASHRWGVENNENSQNAQGWRLSLPQTKGNVWNRLRFLKKHFLLLEELNRRIRENGIKLRLSWIYLFQNISRLPDHYHKTQRTSLSFLISCHVGGHTLALLHMAAKTIFCLYLVKHLIVTLRFAVNVTTSSFQNNPWSLSAKFVFRKR